MKTYSKQGLIKKILTEELTGKFNLYDWSFNRYRAIEKMKLVDPLINGLIHVVETKYYNKFNIHKSNGICYCIRIDNENV